LDLQYQIVYGGLYPPFDQGLQRNTRQNALKPPLIKPNFSIDPMAYSEQVGLNRQKPCGYKTLKKP
jgi:hypothetical protein